MATYQGLTWKQRIERAKKNHKWKWQDHQAAKDCKTCAFGELNGYPKESLWTYDEGPELCWPIYQFANVGTSNSAKMGPAKALKLYNNIHNFFGEKFMRENNLEPRA